MQQNYVFYITKTNLNCINRLVLIFFEKTLQQQ